MVISEHGDAFAAARRKYPGGDSAADYLEEFRKYLAEHQGDMAALRVVTTKPSSLKRRDLRSLLIALDEAGFAESTLREAWHDATNADVAASVLGFIRRQALGALRATRSFSPPRRRSSPSPTAGTPSRGRPTPSATSTTASCSSSWA